MTKEKSFITLTPGGNAASVGFEVVEVGVVARTGGVRGGAADDQQFNVVPIWDVNLMIILRV